MRVVSGIQPTGNLHLGNYLGAIRNWVRMQDEQLGEKLFFLADLHSITVPVEPSRLTANTYEMTAALLACGIDTERSILFNQARVPAHSELAWLLFCTARMGWLSRMTQFKEKSGKNREGASVGLFSYPVLQAADVLIYQATHVPVGEDQKQHLELARDIAHKFNLDFSAAVFTIPEPIIPPKTARIMSLRDGTIKMAKSDPSDMSRINLIDDADLVIQKIRKAKTDPAPLPDNEKELNERPPARNLVGIYAALTDASVDSILSQYSGKGFAVFKVALGECLVETLGPIRKSLLALKDDTTTLDAILTKGAQRASVIAKPTLDAAYAAVGLRR